MVGSNPEKMPEVVVILTPTLRGGRSPLTEQWPIEGDSFPKGRLRRTSFRMVGRAFFPCSQMMQILKRTLSHNRLYKMFHSRPNSWKCLLFKISGDLIPRVIEVFVQEGIHGFRKPLFGDENRLTMIAAQLEKFFGLVCRLK